MTQGFFEKYELLIFCNMFISIFIQPFIAESVSSAVFVQWKAAMIVEGSPAAPSNDPWQATSKEGEDDSSAEGPKSDRFEDNFVDQTSAEKPFEKLPDSEEYLAVLERKLNKLTNPKNQEKSLLKALSERRSDEARRYLVMS